VLTRAHVEELLDSLLDNQLETKPYKSFYPLLRLKGHLHKVHTTGLSNYSRYLYLNPIEGVLISYKNVNKFPHAQNYIVNENFILHLLAAFPYQLIWTYNPEDPDENVLRNIIMFKMLRLARLSTDFIPDDTLLTLL